ncbi:MAG TPA: SGNH/GDSL hydrolase family protein [Candidatus Eisenbacteria bacterium]|nr:SGNH/GDSL hydrolase family protein [Candidatus Eisenbacteria bacterium]
MNRQLFEYHPVVGYKFVPGIKARVPHESGGYLLRTNQAGFRCRHEFPVRKEPGRFRILLFGDSYTAGDGVSDPQRYGDVLEDMLPQTEVFNFGVPGTGLDQQYLIWREFGSPIEHDLVIISVMVENIRRIVAHYRPYLTASGETVIMAKPYFVLTKEGSLDLRHVPVPKDPVSVEALPAEERRTVDRGGDLVLLRRIVNAMGHRLKDQVQRLMRYQPLPGYDRDDHPDWRLMEAILHTWLRETRTPVVVCPIPLYQYVEGTASAAAYQDRFRGLEDPPRVRVHDPLSDFLRHTPEERRGFRFEHDCHLTPSAHRVLAESLARSVRPLVEQRAA